MPPVIIAHRTSPLDAPENSLAGIRRSAELGADFVEIDVRLTRDGVAVMLHDALLLRTTLRPWPVSWATAKGLRRARLRQSGEPVPTFAEAVAALPDGVGFAIDTKAPDAADAVVVELRGQGRLDRALLWAQSERAVRRYVELAGDEAPEVALLRDAFTRDAIDRFLADAVEFGATAISAHQDTVDEAFIDRAHQLGLRVHCWFQDLATQARLATLPLDGIVTDWPEDAAAGATLAASSSTDRAFGVGVALAVLAVSSMLVSDQRFVRGEVPVFEAVNGWPRWIGAPLELVMQLGTMTAGLVTIAGVAVAVRPRGRPVVAVAIATLAAWRVDDVIKEVIERPRPDVLLPSAIVRDDADGFGFPSGHTAMAFALAAVLHPMLPSRLRWLPWVLATMVGTARMYVGVHWPMDLVGGAALGIAIGTAASVLLGDRYGPRRT